MGSQILIATSKLNVAVAVSKIRKLTVSSFSEKNVVYVSLTARSHDMQFTSQNKYINQEQHQFDLTHSWFVIRVL